MRKHLFWTDHYNKIRCKAYMALNLIRRTLPPHVLSTHLLISQGSSIFIAQARPNYFYIGIERGFGSGINSVLLCSGMA